MKNIVNEKMFFAMLVNLIWSMPVVVKTGEKVPLNVTISDDLSEKFTDIANSINETLPTNHYVPHVKFSNHDIKTMFIQLFNDANKITYGNEKSILNSTVFTKRLITAYILKTMQLTKKAYTIEKLISTFNLPKQEIIKIIDNLILSSKITAVNQIIVNEKIFTFGYKFYKAI